MLNPITVLVAEDVIPFRDALVEYLLSFGIQPVSAVNVADVVSLVRDRMVDVLVADLILNGKSVLPALRYAQGLDIPIVLISGFPKEKVDSTLGPLAGTCVYVGKPFELGTLRRHVVSLAERAP